MELLVVIGIVTLVCVLIVLHTRQQEQMNAKPPRGLEPGKGHEVIDTSDRSGGPGGGHMSSTRVPRDPQHYTMAMSPKK